MLNKTACFSFLSLILVVALIASFQEGKRMDIELANIEQPIFNYNIAGLR